MKINPREILWKRGLNSLKDHELIAIILGTGTKNKNVIEISKEFLDNYPAISLNNIPEEKIYRFFGNEKVKAAKIISLLEIHKRLTFPNIEIYKPETIWQEMKYIVKTKKEYFVCFNLNARNQIISREIISIGSLNSSLAYPREIFQSAIKNGALSIIVSHNHPSGDCEPSKEDILLTKKIKNSGEILEIKLLDHIITTQNFWYSFAEKGILD